MNQITPEEYQMAYESAYEFAQKEIRPHNTEIERTDEFPSWLWPRLAEQGFLGVAIPEEYGGSDGDFYMAALTEDDVAALLYTSGTKGHDHSWLAEHL